MKNISLFSFTLCLMISSVCFAESGAFYARMVNLQNSFRRKTTVVFPNGKEEVVYRKDDIAKTFEKCRKAGACKESGIYSINIGSTFNVDEGSSDANKSLLKLNPYCLRAVILAPERPVDFKRKSVPVVTPSAPVSSTSPNTPGAGEVEQLKPLQSRFAEEVKSNPDFEQPAVTQLSDASNQSEERALTFYERNERKISFAVMIGLVMLGYNLIPSPKRGNNSRI